MYFFKNIYPKYEFKKQAGKEGLINGFSTEKDIHLNKIEEKEMELNTLKFCEENIKNLTESLMHYKDNLGVNFSNTSPG